MPRRPQSRCTECRRLHNGFGVCAACKRPKDAALKRRSEWRWVYSDPRWEPLRVRVLSEEPVCATHGCTRPPTVVDHKIPHRGDEQLAFDRANLQAMCKPHHDGKTARETFAKPSNVTLVCGPPCAGKNTYVRQHARPGDLIVDFDAIITALGGAGDHDQPELLRPYAFDARDAVVERLFTRRSPLRAAWIILSAPKASDRDRYRARGAHVVLLLPDEDTCAARAQAARPPEWSVYVRNWFSTYEPDPADEVLAFTTPRHITP